MIATMTDKEKAIAYLAVEVENGFAVSGLSKEDAEAIADFALGTLGCHTIVRPSGPPWKRNRTYAVIA